MRRRLDAPLPLAAWLLGLALLGVFILLAFQMWSWTTSDSEQQRGLIAAIARLDLRGAFDDRSQTSGPGFGLFAQPAYLFVRPHVPQSEANQLAGSSVVVPFVIATIAVIRAVGVAARSARELLLTALVVLGVPTLACFSEQWHPVDVLATALCFAAFASQTRGRRTATMVWLGLALATRQWALIPLAVTIVLEEEGHRLRLLLGAGATAALVVAPFLIANPSGVIDALAARTTIYRDTGAVGLIPMGAGARLVVSRTFPLVFTGLVCLWLHRRRARWDPELAAAAMAATLLFRAGIDPALFLYYLGAGYAFFIIMWRRSWAGPILAFEVGLVLWYRDNLSAVYPGLGPSERPPTVSLAPGRFLAVATTAVIAIGILTALLLARQRLDLPGASASSAAGELAEQAAPTPS